MNKFLSFSRAIFAPAMLLLGSIFLHSCTKEMPILTPSSGTTTGSDTTSSNSTIVLNIDNKTYTLLNKLPGIVGLATATVSLGDVSTSQYSVLGVDDAQTNNLSYYATFRSDSVANKYIFQTSQLSINNKVYSTINASGTAIFKVDKLDDSNDTTSGSFGYYVYDSLVTPKDSLYISGTFNIKE